jgi:hypothetical protein
VSGSRPLKAPDARRNNHAPARGEWVDLQPLEVPVLPPYPAEWYKAEARPFVVPKYLWDLWRADPVTSQWSPGDVGTALDLAQEWAKCKPEHRLRVLTYLGLNARGRRDLRWREPVEVQAAAQSQETEVRRLRIVDPKTEAS